LLLLNTQANAAKAKECAYATQEKIELKKFPNASNKNKKHATHSRHSMTRQLNNDNGLQALWTRTPAPNK